MSELKDSGERQEFQTGAIRDTAEGKLRWSLLPPCVWEKALVPYRDKHAEWMVKDIVGGFVRNGDPSFLRDALDMMLRHNDGLARLAEHLRKGAEKYAAFNWVKGIPVTRCLDSLGRHMYAYAKGLEDEDHYAAIMCNLVFIITYYEQGKKELLDFPGYGVES